MPDITKVLMDDHARMRRLFTRWKQTPDSAEVAHSICVEVMIHAIIEEELVYPLLRDINEDLADKSEDEHGEAKDLVEQIQGLETGDPNLRRLISLLQEGIETHAQDEEEQVFPVLEQQVSEDELYELARQAFARRQELLAEEENPPEPNFIPGLANTGWGAPGRRPEQGMANPGW